MSFVVALLFLAVVALALAVAGVALYYVRVLRPRLEASGATPAHNVVHDSDTLANLVEQLHELARLRDQGILTSREFTSKKTELLERI
jgi:cytochrome c-type biogenesis protein CcmH/NrfG